MTLKEKIEDIIKKIDENTRRLSKYHDGLMFCGNSDKIEQLQWVLSELEKMNCDNCKHKIFCHINNSNEWKNDNRFYNCNNFEEKE